MSNKKSRKKKATKATLTLRKRFAALTPLKKRRVLLKTGGAAALVVLSAGALATYDMRQHTLHDQTVIGNGKPTVVQIHDPSCPVCRSLEIKSIQGA